jgi:hypothetical protein
MEGRVLRNALQFPKLISSYEYCSLLRYSSTWFQVLGCGSFLLKVRWCCRNLAVFAPVVNAISRIFLAVLYPVARGSNCGEQISSGTTSPLDVRGTSTR